jgi:molybdopterin-guanine dinucleotide biosynthesis protein A
MWCMADLHSGPRTSPVEFGAVLLAAGRSTRLGREKASLEVKGVPLWSRQQDVLLRAGAREVLFSVRPDQQWVPPDATVVYDAAPDLGPFGGLIAALERIQQSHLAVLAVDLPRMQPAWFSALLALCAPGVGAVGHRENFYEPLAAIYPRELLPPARAGLARRDLSLQHLIASACAQGFMRPREISPDEAPLFTNWNNAGDMG